MNKEKEIENMDRKELWELGNKYENGIGVEKDIEKAINYFKLSAKKGHAGAQARIGMLYFFGDKKYKIQQDDEKAVKWLTLAAEQRITTAQNILGDIYYSGLGVEHSYYEAFKWYKLAAGNDHLIAQHKLGRCYESGEGIDLNYKKAVNFYRIAADRGLADAQYDLGRCYEEGKGVIQDYKEAFKWYLISCSNARKGLFDTASKKREALKKELTKEQIKEATEEAKQFGNVDRKKIEEENKTEMLPSSSEIEFYKYKEVVEKGELSKSSKIALIMLYLCKEDRPKNKKYLKRYIFNKYKGKKQDFSNLGMKEYTEDEMESTRKNFALKYNELLKEPNIKFILPSDFLSGKKKTFGAIIERVNDDHIKLIYENLQKLKN